MSDGFFHWYRRTWSAGSAERVVEAFEANGIVLTNPSTGVITAISNGPESWGEQIAVERSELFAALELKFADEVNFQLWLDADTDVFTRIRRLDQADMTVVEFGLDGMTADERETVIRAARQAFARDREDTTGLVIDRRGLSEDVDWDGVMTGQDVRLDIHPDFFGVRPEVVARHPQLADAPGRAEPPLVVFSRDLL
ncbi:hypothetical protein OHT76_27670 [Streptomyces sp. NBC_00287]|uniref:hypothetical protein n=1 Tax=Streptomyces sp. NBC_00287 TaxID=2975702 RepID=UPI002E298DA0|nr:hypothetical protein [Streptomyces sp. NBC_00287]